MNRMPMQLFSTDNKRRCLMLAVVCCCLGWGLSAVAYQNTQVSIYYSPATAGQQSPPNIDDPVFDNESTFEVNFNAPANKAILYETSDTLYYTNGDSALLIANSPFATNILTGGFANFDAYGAGFQFDEKTKTGHYPANTFYNSGTIRCDSILDGNNSLTLDGETFYELFSVGTFIVNATNIYNPGDVVAGVDSLVEFTGQNVDLSRSSLTIEPLLPGVFGFNNLLTAQNYNTVNISSIGYVGLDTNGDWNPGGPALIYPYNTLYPLTLSPTNAISSEPYLLALSNSASYFKLDANGPSNIVVKAVFVQNNSPNAPYNVYIDPLYNGNFLSGLGTANVEWVGSYTDPATGNTVTNYLYLNDDYVLGASTNVQVFPGPGNNGYPDNFTFAVSPTPLLVGRTPQGFYPFPNAYITNYYAYMNGQIIPTSVTTNINASNPYGGVTNVLGRVQITGNTELNINNALISGQNYLSIQATNQFDANLGALITSPYSDINVGVTNGQMNVTNLLISDIPNWSGTVQAWSTRWTNTDAVTGINYDYRVLLVYSQLQPTSQPWVQNLTLRTGTNLVISDVLNVYGKFFTDAQNVTVTTNGYGVGAASPEGQFNAYFAANLGAAQWPNLRNVTNDGVISAQNLMMFTNGYASFTTNGVTRVTTTNYANLGAFINNGVIIDQGTFVYANNFYDAGTISNGLNGLVVQSQNSTFSNAYVYAQGAINIGAKNLVASNLTLQCLSLTLTPTNLLTDGFTNNPGATNVNFWTVGATNGSGGKGFVLASNPGNGDLLGTTITNICPPVNKLVANTWAGQDYGAVNRGFSNNAALGHLILDVQGSSSLITFTGAGNAMGNSNALYVDSLEFQGSATNGLYHNYNFTNWLALNTNIVIYFAQAYVDGISVAEKINNASLYNGQNGGLVSNNVVLVPGRLRWVPTYTGYFSSTNIVTGGVTNTVNAALAQSPDIDSNGNGQANAYDPSPFFTAQQINFSLTLTNHPTRAVLLNWYTVPFATNYVYYATNLVAGNWLLYSNFLSTNVVGPTYPVTVSDTNISKGIRFYKVVVSPWLTYPY